MQQTIKPIAGIFTYAVGISLVSLVPQLPPNSLVAIIGTAALILTIIALVRSPGCFPLGMLLLGITFGLGYGKWLQTTAFPAELEQQELEIRGEILDLPVLSEQSARFNFKILEGQYKGVITKVRLSWFSPPVLSAGQHWQLVVKMRRPHGFASPGAFDFEAWAARGGIQAIGYVRSGLLLDNSQHVGSIRSYLSCWLDENAPPSNRGLLKALLIGDKSAIEIDQWHVFNKTGTTHLLVISGLHIGLMALLGYWFALLLARLGIFPLQRIPLSRLAGCFSLAFAFFYAFLAGMGVPVQRALVMTTVALIGPLVGVKPSPVSLLVIALAAVLTIDPLAVTSVGFWYSFMAVMALVYGLSGRVGKTTILTKLVYPQWVVFCVLTPLLFYNGQPVSLLSPFINLLAIPFVGLIVVPLLMLTAGFCVVIPALSHPLLGGLDKLLTGFVWGLERVSDITITVPCSGQPGLIALLFAVGGGLLLISPLSVRLKLLSPLFFLPWLYPGHQTIDAGKAEITLMDVGQGLAVLVRTHNYSLVYDTGDAFSDRFNAADRVVIPYLRHIGLRRLDKIIISHGDKDHSGGLSTLLDSYNCPSITCGTAIPGFYRPVTQCRAGQHWSGMVLAFRC